MTSSSVAPQEDPGAARPLGGVIARNTAFSVGGRVASVIGWIVVAPLMLRLLGPERFGLWSVLTAISGLYLTLDLGLGSAVTKFVAEFRAARATDALRAVFTLATLFVALIGLAISVTMILAREPVLGFLRVGPGLHDEAAAALILAGVGFTVMSLHSMFGAVLGGLHRFDLWNRIVVSVTVIQLAAVALTLALGGGVPHLMAVMAVAYLGGIVASRRVIRAIAPEIAWDSTARRPGLARRLVRYGAAIQVVNLGSLALFHLDKVLFARFLSLAAAGEYELGMRVTFAAWTFPAYLLPALLPAFAQLQAEGDHARVVRLYRRGSRYVLAIAWPLMAGVVALSPVLVLAWLGPGHGQAARSAMALALLLAVNGLTGVGSAVARGIGRPGIEAEYHVLAMALHLPMSLLWIPAFGFDGGLAALVLSGAIGSIWFVVRFHRALGIPLASFLADAVARPVLAAALGGVAAWWVAAGAHPLLVTADRGGAVLRFALGALALVSVAGATLVATRFVTVTELRDLGRMVRHTRGSEPPAP